MITVLNAKKINCTTTSTPYDVLEYANGSTRVRPRAHSFIPEVTHFVFIEL